MDRGSEKFNLHRCLTAEKYHETRLHSDFSLVHGRYLFLRDYLAPRMVWSRILGLYYQDQSSVWPSICVGGRARDDQVQWTQRKFQEIYKLLRENPVRWGSKTVRDSAHTQGRIIVDLPTRRQNNSHRGIAFWVSTLQSYLGGPSGKTSPYINKELLSTILSYLYGWWKLSTEQDDKKSFLQNRLWNYPVLDSMCWKI